MSDERRTKTDAAISSLCVQRLSFIAAFVPTGHCEYCVLKEIARLPSPFRPTRRAFTTLELLIVVGIIALLAAILVISLKAVGGHANANATKVTLENCKAMLATYQADTKLAQPGEAMWTAAGTATPGAFDFWRNAIAYPAAVSAPMENADNPGFATEVMALNTGVCFDTLCALPANRAALQKVSANQMSVAMQSWASGATYSPGALLRDTTLASPAGTEYFRCTSATAGTTAPSGDSTHWEAITSSLLDAWHHPILYVPASGLLNTTSGVLIRSTGTSTNVTTATIPGLIGTERPFFASAGPDGVFGTGDDLYSFQD